MSEIAQTPLEPTAERAASPRASDNPLVRAVGRVPLPLRAKLLIGFGVVGALLAIGYILGFVALGQSNSRGEKVRALLQAAAYARLLEGDANQLTRLAGSRAANNMPSEHVAEDNDVFGAVQLFNADIRQPIPGAVPPHFAPRLERTLAEFENVWFQIYESDTHRIGAAVAFDKMPRAQLLSSESYDQASRLVAKTTTRADALVASNHQGFVNSRNLLIGVGAGSLALALALALLLSSSVVMPLRRTRTRLAAIAVGDFSGRVEVPNRDEIGGLAADVNAMSDELQRVHRQLELASEHKSQFLANMSHELRTPLNAIIGFTEVLREQMFGELNERQLAYVNDVLEAGRHLLSLINDVLDLAKIEAGRMDLELSQVAIPHVLESAVSMHSERASRSGIELSLTSEPDEITVTADERRVRQIVFNLLSNAVKFTPADGRVDVSARLDDSYVEIAVADTGPGIPAADVELIFEEFEQTADGKKAEGTGLGLPLSRKLVELHGGRLWVDSEPGHGSTFRFTLPVQQEVS